jgi:chromosome segregation ATPase
MSVILATTPAAATDQDEQHVPAARTAAPETKTERVQTAIRALLAATDFDEYALAQELDQVRKREVAEYVQSLAAAADRLSTLAGAATDQADQFTGSADTIGEAEHNLGYAHQMLADLADELHPIID